jgi:hypothetical protein
MPRLATMSPPARGKEGPSQVNALLQATTEHNKRLLLIALCVYYQKKQCCQWITQDLENCADFSRPVGSVAHPRSVPEMLPLIAAVPTHCLDMVILALARSSNRFLKVMTERFLRVAQHTNNTILGMLEERMRMLDVVLA